MKIPTVGNIVSSKCVAAVSVGLALTVSSGVSHAQDSDTRTYRVEVTNITGANQFTPVLATTHTPRASLFTLGRAPRVGLATLAETGDTSALQQSLIDNGNVSVVQTVPFPGDVPLTFAGTTLEFTIEAEEGYRFFSMAAMILPTNDAFVALDNVPLPTRGSSSYYALGYDAGSEVNDELCVNIPGPTCGGSGAFSGLNGEGFVHISSGIHGDGDLNDAVYDWRNPVANVVITLLD